MKRTIGTPKYSLYKEIEEIEKRLMRCKEYLRAKNYMLIQEEVENILLNFERGCEKLEDRLAVYKKGKLTLIEEWPVDAVI